jgi:predicted PurR-regulated permease PerM
MSAASDGADRQRVDIHLHLPTRTVVKVLATALLVWAGLLLWPEFIFVVIALLLAVALHPVVVAFERRGLPRGVVVAGLAVVMVAAAVLLVMLVFTSLSQQMSTLIQDFPGFRDRVEARLPPAYPTVKRVVMAIFALPSSPEIAAQLRRPVTLGTAAVAGVVSAVFTLIVTLYLLLDGKRLYAWVIAYVPRANRDRVAQTAEEVSEVIYAYVRGQVITSALFGAYTLIVLHVLRVPAALPLAVLAGLCDVIPMVGIILATLPAVLLALTLSPATAAIVMVFYVGYHLLEAYLIVPRVYGQRLRLSTLAVLLALMVGTTLQGLIGAVLVLPLVAAYPIIERIWLARYLGAEVLKDHRALAKSDEPGNEDAVDTVLQGERHPWEGPSNAQTRRTELPSGRDVHRR